MSEDLNSALCDAPRVGFVGLGHMGEPMATRLVRVGVDLTVWNRSRGKPELFRAEGATIAASAREVFEGCDLVITMLANGPVTEETRVLGG